MSATLPESNILPYMWARPINDKKADLLYYRISSDFSSNYIKRLSMFANNSCYIIVILNNICTSPFGIHRKS